MADTEEIRICPRCASHFMRAELETNALSRTTRAAHQQPIYVCSWCGQQEGIEEMGGKNATPQSMWPIVHNIPIFATSSVKS